MSLNSSAFAAKASPRRSRAGSRGLGGLLQAARWTADGKTSFELAHIHVVVWVGTLAGEVGDDLVGVHVRGRARAGLEDVDRELVVVLAGRHRVGGGPDPLGQVGVEEPEIGVDPGGGALDAAEPSHDGTGTRSPETGKLSTALRVSPPQSSFCVSSTVMGLPHQHREAWTLAAAPGPGSGVTLRGSSGSPQWLQTSVGTAWWPHS